MVVEGGRGHSDALLRGARMEELSEADKHLATALVMGVLRWQIALDAQVRRWLERPDQTLPVAVAVTLRMGAFQLLHMDRIPAHAALSESVELCRAAGHPHATGMVNAVLRRLAREPAAAAPIYETTARAAERLGHPGWLVERWGKAYGREAALRICGADQEEPGRGGIFSEGRSEGGEGLPEIDDGSRLVAELAAAAASLGAKVWDCCAAPGGKTLVLAKRLPGAEILATDVSSKRLAAMQGRLRRYEYASGVMTAVADALALPESAGSFDLVLCDVPCSGTGTLGRNPEIRLRLAEAELARQAARQGTILQAALKRVAPGGRLVYSTCSLEREENEDVVAQAAKGWRKVPVQGLLEGLGIAVDGMESEGALRTLPGVHRCDGFYAVVLERAG